MRSQVTKTYNRAPRRNQTLLSIGLLAAFAVVVVVMGALAFNVVRDFVVSLNILPDLTVDPDDTDVNVDDFGIPVWTGTDRVTILMLGIDMRPDEEGPTRSDSMLLLTIDPVVKTAAVLSIPRDLWVPIRIGEQIREGRINSAHYWGEYYEYPGGGPALAADTVEYNLGVPVDYYARVDFQAFEQLIDQIGGIDVYVEEEIWDPEYPDETYGFDPLYIAEGMQHFNGETALKYARVRHGGSDYDRIQRQQNVLRAVFDKVTRLDMIPSLVPIANDLWETLQDSVVVSPDLTLTKIIALAGLAAEVDSANLGFYAIDQNYTVSWTTPDGKIVEIPQREQIRELRDHIFSAQPLPTGDDPQSQLEAEAAQVQVLNGTTIAGLASETAETLRLSGVNVADVGNAERSNYTESLVIVYGQKNYTADHIVEQLGLQPTAIVNAGSPAGSYDITVILGSDFISN